MYRLFAITCLLAAIFSSACGSAIPMWEYLSRGEKMSHLFQMFGKQVDEYCDTQTMPDCNKVLLVYGMSNLHKMNDEHLDSMDPYQRGATDIIWDAMMKGNYKPTGDDDQDDLSDPYATGSDALEPSTSNAGNGLGSDGAASSVEEYISPLPGHSGPMMVRLLPDGRPVPGDVQGPVPVDEDHEEFKLMRSKPMPSVAEITRRIFPAPKPAEESSYSQRRNPTEEGGANPLFGLPSVEPSKYNSGKQQDVRPAYSLPAQYRSYSV